MEKRFGVFTGCRAGKKNYIYGKRTGRENWKLKGYREWRKTILAADAFCIISSSWDIGKGSYIVLFLISFLFACFMEPLHAILIFSSIGFAEEEGNCNDLLAIKNQIHIRLLQFLFSSILTIISVFGSGMIFFSCEMGTMANVLLFSMILGSIDTMVKQRFGAAVGTFTAVGIYIFAAVSL